MGGAVTVRRARAGEGRAVAMLVHHSLPPALAEKTIWHCHGIDRYVEDRLAIDPATADHRYYLLLCGDVPAGAAEYRHVRGDAFLNHICVAPAHQGEGLGRRLLHQTAQDYLSQRRSAAVVLDVDAENERTREWYQRLGFRQISESYWQVGRPRSTASPTSAPSQKGRMHGFCRGRANSTRRRSTLYPASAVIKGSPKQSSPLAEWRADDAVFERYGFCSFTFQTPTGRYRVGRLGSPYFRLEEKFAWLDETLHATLRALEPSCRVLLITHEPVADLPIVRHALRLEADARKFLQKLETASRLPRVFPSSLSTFRPMVVGKQE